MDVVLYILAIVAGAVAMRLLLWRRWRELDTDRFVLGNRAVELEELENGLGNLEVELEERESEIGAVLDSASVFAWSIKRDFDRPIPGPDDEPVLYILPGGEKRTNSCEEARRAWLNAAVEAGVELKVKPHPKLVETYGKRSG